jgi:ribosomal protein L1
MPNPKTGTGHRRHRESVREVKAGRVEFKLDKNGNVRRPVGKFSFEGNALLENGTAVIEAVVRARLPQQRPLRGRPEPERDDVARASRLIRRLS